MREGLLWFDADPRRSPQRKADDAAARFRERFGYPADCCRVNPADLFHHPSLRVVADPAVLRHHFFVGCEDGVPEATARPSTNRRRRSA